MDLSFYPLTLEALEQAAAESLCLFVGEDERPLSGLAGLADWRLAGSLSRWLRAGILLGAPGEALLTPMPALGFQKLFLFGLGPGGQSAEQLAARTAECIRRLQAAGVESVALQLPARLQPQLGIRTLIDAPQAPARALVFAPDPGALVHALSSAASRGPGEAKHERRVIKVAPPSRQSIPVKAFVPAPSAQPELPRAKPLPFATTSSSGRSGVGIRTAGAAGPATATATAPAPSLALSPDPAPAPPPAPAPDDVPIAPAVPDSDPPAPRPVVPPTRSSSPGRASAPALPVTSRKLLSQSSPGRVPLPVDHQAPRYKPPPASGGGKGGRKKRK